MFTSSERRTSTLNKLVLEPDSSEGKRPGSVSAAAPRTSALRLAITWKCRSPVHGPRFGSWIHHAVEPLSAVAATACEASAPVLCLVTLAAYQVWYVKASDIKYLPEHLLKAIQHCSQCSKPDGQDGPQVTRKE